MKLSDGRTRVFWTDVPALDSRPWPFDGLAPASFGTVCVDPPWDHGITQRLGGRGRRPSAGWQRYSTLSLDELAALPVPDLLGDSGHVWVWVTNRVLAAGDHRQVLEAWGVRPVTLHTWLKVGAPGLGRYLRNTTEHAVLAVKGWGSVPEAPAASTWARAGHSAKPAGFGDLVEQVSPGPYVELFARQQRLGWSSWGWGHET